MLFFLQDLEYILNLTSIGQKVLSNYRQHNKFVKDSSRDLLVECVLEEETRKSGLHTMFVSVFKFCLVFCGLCLRLVFLISSPFICSISHARLKFLAEKIVELFPGEYLVSESAASFCIVRISL